MTQKKRKAQKQCDRRGGGDEPVAGFLPESARIVYRSIILSLFCFLFFAFLKINDMCFCSLFFWRSSYDDFTLGVIFLIILQRVGNFVERVSAVDDGFDPASFDQLFQKD